MPPSVTAPRTARGAAWTYARTSPYAVRNVDNRELSSPELPLIATDPGSARIRGPMLPRRLQTAFREHGHRVTHEGRGPLAVPVVDLREAGILDVHLAEPGELLRRRSPALPAGLDPLVVPSHERLHLVAVWTSPGRVRPPELGGDLERPTPEVVLLVPRQRAPPLRTLVVGRATPALDHLVPVPRAVEAVENLVGHQSFTCLRLAQRRAHRLDLTFDPRAFLFEQPQVGFQRRHGVAVTVEDLRDGGQPESQLAQQQNPLQPHERALVVVAGSRWHRCGSAGAGRSRRSDAASGSWSPPTAPPRGSTTPCLDPSDPVPSDPVTAADGRR